jgi:hypothetical protein
MIKIGTSNGKTLVALSNAEFTGLAGQTTSNFPDNSVIDLTPVKDKLDLVDSNTAELTSLKTNCQNVIDGITAIGL